MKYKFNIHDLDCANCAKKIEETLNKDKNIKSASINFAKQTVIVETNISDPFNYVKDIVKKIEPDAILSKEEIKERMNSEIHAPSDNIEIPSYLTKNQKAKFEFYANQLLDLNIMSNLDSEALAKYITTNDRYEMVTKKLRTSEVKNNITLFEYYSKAQERYLKLSRSMANDLGLSISSRCKLVVPHSQNPPQQNPSKFDKFRKENNSG